eukprot:3050633-Rhodomonas_salina.1
MEPDLFGPAEDCENSPREGCLFPCTCEGIGKCPLHSDTNDRYVENTQSLTTSEEGYLAAPEQYVDPSIEAADEVVEQPLPTSVGGKRKAAEGEKIYYLLPLQESAVGTLKQICEGDILKAAQIARERRDVTESDKEEDLHFIEVELNKNFKKKLPRKEARSMIKRL